MVIDYSKIKIENSFSYENTNKELHEIAYFLWERAGKPEGRDLEFWCDAEREMFGYTCGEMDELYSQYSLEEERYL